MDQRSGRPAQDEFKLLCSERNITCNPSLEDDHGWDFIMEIPTNVSDRLLADKVPAPRPVLVQVKFTSGKTAKTRIKLSNALKFANNELPCFVVLFHYNKNGKRQQIYVCHFWKDLIERALKRGRKVSVERKPTNQSMMSVSFIDQDNHSDDLIKWMINTVNALPIGYSNEKRKLANNLGYEEQNYRGKLAIGPLRDIEELVDHQLGLTDYLPVKYIKLTDSRFNIDDPTPILESTSGQIRLRPNDSIKCTLVIQGSDNDSISVPATIRTPAIPGLPLDKFKISIETWLFRAVTPLGKFELTLRGEDLSIMKLPIAQLDELVRFLSWGNDSISMKAIKDGVPLFACRGNVSSNIQRGLCLNFANITKNLLDIQSLAGVSTVHISLIDLQNSLNILSVLHEILTAKDMKLEIEPGPEWKNETSISHVIGYIDIEVGEFTFLILFDAPVSMRQAPENVISLLCGERALRDCFVGKDADSVLLAGQTSYEEHRNLHGPECLGLDNIRTFID